VGALHVSQNGVLIAGTSSVSANGQAILFTPSSNSAYNATIQVFLDTTATDTNGNSVNSYSGAFTTAAAPPNPATVSPTVANLSPVHTSTISVANPVVDIQFTKNIAATSVNTTNFYLLRNDTGSPTPATVTLPFPNMVRIAPSTPLDPTGQPYYRIHILSAVRDTDGNTYTGPTGSYYFYVLSTAVPDTNVPTVVAVAPSNGSTVGDNALINVTFSKPMETNTINAATLTVNGGVVPASFSFGGSNTNVVVTPLAPLPDNSSLSLTSTSGVNGIVDPQGNAITTQTINFSVGNGPDITPPYVVSSTVDNGLTVPSNSACGYFQ
jgi:hypothetical protein